MSYIATQGGLVMAAIRSAAEMEQLRREFLVRAQAAFEQMFGADGQNGLVTFTEREDRACEVTDALARRSGRTGESELHERSCTLSRGDFHLSASARMIMVQVKELPLRCLCTERPD